MSPSYTARLIDGEYRVVEVDGKIICPYCDSSDLESDESFDSVISGERVDWYVCKACGSPVEVVEGITMREGDEK